MADSMDLSVIRQQALQEAWVTITHPVTGAETTMRIKLLSPDCDAYRIIENGVKNTGIQQAGRRGGRMTAEELNENGMQLLVQATTGWEGVIFDGQEMPFSAANVRLVYSEFPFIKEQVDRFLADRRNFFQS